MNFPLNPRASYAYRIYYFTMFVVCLCIQAFGSISPYECMFMYPCFLSISPYLLYVYVSKLLTLFHHTILYIYVSMLLLYFTILLVCLCIQVTCTISLYRYVYVSKLLALFHHIVCMFMYPHLCTISPCILIVRVMYPYLYAISPYRLVCLCIHVFTLFHHIAMFMYPRYLHYFTIHMCLCIHVFVLFHHIY
jgi:hypothetical protein